MCVCACVLDLLVLFLYNLLTMQAYRSRAHLSCRSLLDLLPAEVWSAMQNVREVHVLLHVGIVHGSDRAMQ